METSGQADAALREARAHLEAAVTRLAAADARDEQLAAWAPRRRIFGIDRGQAMVGVERVWRLGVLLLGRSGRLYATGQIVRAVESGHPNRQSKLAEERRRIRVEAVKAGFADGDTVNIAAQPIDLAVVTESSPQEPVLFADGRLRVRWSPTSGALMDFGSYVDERVDLLISPPQGA
ncbi:MAG TPA: hypothetical protein VNT53_04490 [Pseudolysinimonas sp.]|nr:hypothetical protein [Pseudolysinimonas sp.]